MELRLVNFRCYREKTFVFPKGVLLIDGPSGKGKTTILNAIKYALFGKVTQISTYGEKKTSVTLIYNEIKIVRTNVPSRLLLTYSDKTMEDDAAQEYIYQLFGRQFELTSYMVQKGAIQFFTLSGAEKLKLLEQLSLLGEDRIQCMKDTIQRDIKEKKRQTERIESQIELLENQLGTKPNIVKKKGFLTLSDIQQMITFIKSVKNGWEEHRMKNNILLETYTDQLKRHRSEKMVRDSISHSLQLDLTEKNRLEDEKKINETDESEFICLERKLFEYDQYVLFNKKQNEYIEKIKVYENVVQQETEYIALQIKEWKEKMVQMNDSVSDVRNQITQLEKIKTQWKQLQDIYQLKQKEEHIQQQIIDLKTDDDLHFYQDQILSHDQYLFYNSVEKELNEIKKRYKEQFFSYQNEIYELEKQLQKEPILTNEKEEIQMCTEQLLIWKRIHVLRKELSNEKLIDIESRLESTKKQKEKMENFITSMETRKKVQACPQCNTSLIIHTNQIVSATHQPISESDKKIEEKYKIELPKWHKQYENQYRLLLSRDEWKKEEENLITKVDGTDEKELQQRLETLTTYLESVSIVLQKNSFIKKQLYEKQDPILKYKELENQCKDMEKTLLTLPIGKLCTDIELVKEKVVHIKLKKDQLTVLYQTLHDVQKEKDLISQDAQRFIYSYQRFITTKEWDPDFFTYMHGKTEEELQIHQIQKKLEQVVRDQQTNDMIKEQLSSLELNKPHLKYQNMKQSINQLEKELYQLPRGVICECPEQVREKLNQCVSKKKEYDRVISLLEQLNQQIQIKEKQLDVEFDDTDYESLMSKVMKSQSFITEKILIPSEQLQELSIYYEQVKLYLSYRKKEKEIHEKKMLCAIYYSQLEQLESLFQHILYSEGICLEQFIRRVNQKMKWYLEHFFEDQSLQMELCTEKECKSGKVKNEICVSLIQHQQPCELKNLSGGEYDRCALAFMLTINELSHSPCLFLDESISSLDMSLSEHVLDVIKEKQTELGKIVLLISHQANTGFFDHIIRV